MTKSLGVIVHKPTPHKPPATDGYFEKGRILTKVLKYVQYKLTAKLWIKYYSEIQIDKNKNIASVYQQFEEAC